MNSRATRATLIVVGAIAVIVGGIFAAQGANLLPGSSMTGEKMWLYIGLIVLIVGLILIGLGVRRGPSGRGRL